MRTRQEIYDDMTAAAYTIRSTDHSRALSGAQWLQQLAAEIVSAIKAEATPEPPQKPQYDSPGEGWRWLEPGEVIQKGDEHEFHQGEWMAVGISIGREADAKKFFRRRI